MTTENRPKAPPPPTPRAGPPRVTWEPYQLDGIDVRLWRYPGPTRSGVPAVDPNYKFRESRGREFAWATWPHDGGAPAPCLLVGPKGSGKTTLVEQIAARSNVPVMRYNLNVGTSVRHLKGKLAAGDGRTFFSPGVCTMAMEQGAWLLLDEMSGATPPVALALFPVLEPGGAVLLEDEQPPRYVVRHPDFRIYATDNTIGNAQEDGRFNYSGTNPDVNEALLDRFGSTIQVGYLDKPDEHALVMAKVPGIDSDDLEGMIRVIDGVRRSGTIGVTLSTRTTIEWARRVAAGRVLADGTVKSYTGDDVAILACAESAFLCRVRSKAERDAIVETYRRVFGGGK